MSSGLATLHPAYFAVVMATGIVSIACHLAGFGLLAITLLGANVVFFVGLWAMTIARIVWFRDRVIADLLHHGRGVGFFTIVAGTCVLGSQSLVVAGAWRVALWLWLAGIVLWAVVTYTVFGLLTVKSEKPSLADGINGGWLVAVVSAQSVSALGSQLAQAIDAPFLLPIPRVFVFIALGAWTLAMTGLVRQWLRPESASGLPL